MRRFNMGAFPSAPCGCALLLAAVCSLIARSSELNTIKVKAGQNALLQCHAPTHAIITLLEWIRPDLDSQGYVFFHRDGHFIENYQHPSFVNRVELRDPEMKDGDVSVILKNVSSNDTGTYHCYVFLSKPSRHKRALPDFNKTIELVVEDPENPGGIRGYGHRKAADFGMLMFVTFACDALIQVTVGHI